MYRCCLLYTSALKIAVALGLTGPLLRQATKLITNVYKLFTALDCSLVAVSYTHLDVYKRQEMTGEAALLAIAFRKSARASGAALRMMFTHPL